MSWIVISVTIRKSAFGWYVRVRFYHERFVDREGQDDPEAYRRKFNKRIGIAA